MAIVFQCLCGQEIRANETLAGLSTRCPGCGTVCRIPAPGDDSATVAGEASGKRPEGFHPGEVRSLSESEAQSNLDDLPDLGSSDGSSRLRAEIVQGWKLPSAPEPAAGAVARSRLREYLYVLLALALVPLGMLMFAGEPESVAVRFERTIKNARPEDREAFRKLFESQEDVNFDEMFGALPGGRIDQTAHLSRSSRRHWLYAALAATAFWLLCLTLFPDRARKPAHLLMVGLFTGTGGIILLLAFQKLAAITQGYWLQGGNVLILGLFYLAKFIGFSYMSANDPDTNLLVSLAGFLFGVGLCEELCKILPVLNHYRRDARMGWRDASVWGLMSGVGFGISEGVMYSGNEYNGISPVDVYVVRFLSCVALHALWTGSAAIMLWKRQETVQGDPDWGTYTVAVLRILAVPIVLHGLYDTFLKKDYDVLALVVGVLSFAWFAWQVETARRTSAVPSVHAWD